MKQLEYQKPNRLTFKEGNPKTDKNKKVEGLENYRILRLNLAPADLSGFNVCPMASAGCKAACLHTAGNPIFQKQKDKGRINRTRYYMQSRVEFLNQLTREIKNFEIWCSKNNFIPVVRLNTTSDIPWEIHGIFELFPNIQFYDYTKIFKRDVSHIKNYHLTWSYSEANQWYANQYKTAIKNGMNIAVVFRDKNLPKKFLGLKVIDGDKDDLRFLDPENSIVGLYAKGDARKDTSGFVID